MNNTPTPNKDELNLDNLPLKEALRFVDENSTTGGLFTKAALKTLAAGCRELTAAREELAELKEEYGTWWAQKRIAIDELKEVIEQRDRLAAALQEMWPFIEEDDYPACNTPSFNAAIKKYKEALQSLNQPAVRGGADES